MPRVKSIDLADEKFVENITLIKFFKRKNSYWISKEY
jgi:hypothetical protein